MEDDGVFPARQEDSFLFLAARLGQADHGEIRVSDLPESVQGGGELAQSPVDQDQVRQRQILCLPVAPSDHLLHAGEVVGPFDGLDAELAVVRFLGLPVLPDHHGGDGLGAHRVGDVKPFDPPRSPIQAEQPLQLFSRLAVGLLVPEVIGHRRCGVLLRQQKQLVFRPALRRDNPDRLALLLR